MLVHSPPPDRAVAHVESPPGLHFGSRSRSMGPAKRDLHECNWIGVTSRLSTTSVTLCSIPPNQSGRQGKIRKGKPRRPATRSCSHIGRISTGSPMTSPPSGARGPTIFSPSPGSLRHEDLAPARFPHRDDGDRRPGQPRRFSGDDQPVAFCPVCSISKPRLLPISLFVQVSRRVSGRRSSGRTRFRPGPKRVLCPGFQTYLPGSRSLPPALSASRRG